MNLPQSLIQGVESSVPEPIVEAPPPQSAMELVNCFGSVHYAATLMGDRRDPYPVPRVWLNDAHELSEGSILDAATVCQLRNENPESLYGAFFEDKGRYIWQFVHSVPDSLSMLRTNHPNRKSAEIPKEVHLWLQAVAMAVGLPELPPLEENLPSLELPPESSDGSVCTS